MTKHNPEKEVLKHRDEVHDAQMEETAQAFRLEAYKAQGSDKSLTKIEDTVDGSSETSLADVMQGIAEKAMRLPPELREEVMNNNKEFVHPALLTIVNNPEQFKLASDANPEDIKAFLAKVMVG